MVICIFNVDEIVSELEEGERNCVGNLRFFRIQMENGAGSVQTGLPDSSKGCMSYMKQSHVLASLKLPDTVLSVYDLVSSSDLNKRIYFLSVYEMASRFSARCARRPFLKKNIVNQWKKELACNFLSVYD